MTTKGKVIRWCLFLAGTILIALSFIRPAEGQYRVDDINTYPAAIHFECENCDPTDVAALVPFVADAAMANWKLCVDTGYNQWNVPANNYDCGRGQFIVINEFGDTSLTYYTGFIPNEESVVLLAIMYFTPAKTLADGKCYHLKACEFTNEHNSMDQVTDLFTRMRYLFK